MKLMLSLLCALFMTSAFAVGENLSCVQRTDRTPVKPGNGLLSVKIKTLADITANSTLGGNYDAVYRVKVDVISTKQGKKTVLKSFTATATSYDVQFNVWSNKANGVGIYVYLDELEEAGIQLTDANGKKTKISLNCSGTN